MDGLKILIIDDEPAIVNSLVLYFSKKGYNISGLTSGEEALAVIAQESFNIVITDLHMSPITGFEIIDVVRLRHPKTLLVAMSGKYSREDVAGLDIDYFFEKPFSLRDIEKHIKERLVLKNS